MPGDALQVLVLAPFERGEELGGSQRATALAERLEARGAEVVWLQIERAPVSRAGKLRAMARGEPTMVTLYPPPAGAPGIRCDVTLVAHSYLARHAEALAPGTPRVVDFHNLEWQHLADASGLDRHGTVTGAPLRGYRAAQVGLTRRYERSVIREGALSLFVSEPELTWAESGPADQTMLVRSVLPASTERAAEEIAAGRSDRRGGRSLVYVGSLRFPPNVLSLLDFLERKWPAIRDRSPAAELLVAGGCDDAVRARIDQHSGVTSLGYVEDLVPRFRDAAGALMPFGGRAGTSLRVLFYGLAGIPVIGSPEAFRGFPAGVGMEAGTAREWASQVERLARDPFEEQVVTAVERAREEVTRIQTDPVPWDDLHRAMRQLKSRREP